MAETRQIKLYIDCRSNDFRLSSFSSQDWQTGITFQGTSRNLHIYHRVNTYSGVQTGPNATVHHHLHRCKRGLTAAIIGILAGIVVSKKTEIQTIPTVLPSTSLWKLSG